MTASTRMSAGTTAALVHTRHTTALAENRDPNDERKLENVTSRTHRFCGAWQPAWTRTVPSSTGPTGTGVRDEQVEPEPSVRVSFLEATVNSQTDFYFSNHGSLWLVLPATADARAHLDAHVQPDALWFGAALVVEPRYVADLASELLSTGFEVR